MYDLVGDENNIKVIVFQVDIVGFDNFIGLQFYYNVDFNVIGLFDVYLLFDCGISKVDMVFGGVLRQD